MFSRFWHLLRSRYDGMYENQRRALIFLVALSACALVISLGWMIGKPFWVRWRHQQAMAQVDAFSRQHDNRNLLLALRRATEIAPGDLATWRRVATELERLGLSDAVLARENIVRLSPADFDARLQLAAAALRFDQPDAGLDALKDVTPAPARAVEIQRLSAELARAMGDEDAFAEKLRAVLALAPADSAARLNLALLDLWHGAPGQRPQALASLAGLLDDPAMRVRAAIELLRDAARSNDPERAGTVVRLLIAHLPAAPQPVAASDLWSQLLASLEHAAGQGSADDVTLTARWLASVRQTSGALAWLDTLPAPLSTSPRVRDVTAEVAAQTGDYGRLQTLLLAGAWGPDPGNALPLAIASRLQHERRADERARATWTDALDTARESPATLVTLARLAQIWQDDAAAAVVLRRLVTLTPKRFWAYASLRDIFVRGGNDLDLLWLYGKWQAEAPDDADLAAHWIETACLLNRVSPAVEARLAALAAQSPDSPPTTLALIAFRWRQGDFNGAAALLQKLSLTTRSAPPFDFWTLLISANSGQTPDASLLNKTLVFIDLSTIRQALADEARRKLAALPRTPNLAPDKSLESAKSHLPRLE